MTRYRIVGADEAEPRERRISIDSPLARALLKKRVDDEVSVAIGGETTWYLIVGGRRCNRGNGPRRCRHRLDCPGNRRARQIFHSLYFF